MGLPSSSTQRASAVLFLTYISYLPSYPQPNQSLSSAHKAAREVLTLWLSLVPMKTGRHQCHGNFLLAPTKLLAMGLEAEPLCKLQMCLAPRRSDKRLSHPEYPSVRLQCVPDGQ